MMIASAAAAFAWTGASARTLTEADATSVATMQVGEPIEIRLKSDTTSPVQWIWTGDVNFSVLEADGMTTEPGTAPNEEFRVYKFKTIGKGNTAIMFFLRRGGEGPDEGVEPLIYEVRVQ
jgi:predicted secreted protein